jgi:hypothetical protein
MPPLPTEVPRPLYEILPEVRAGGVGGDIYQSSHGYALPSAHPASAALITPRDNIGEVNIQKNIDITKQAAKETQDGNEKEDEKKKKEKKDKYKVKF